MAIRKPELGCFPDSFGPLGAHTQRKTSVTHLESTKKIQAFPDDFQIPDFGIGKSCFPDRKVRNLKSTGFSLCSDFWEKIRDMEFFEFT